MTRQDLFIKWSHYGAAALLVFFLERCVFARLPVWGCIPMLIPLVVVMVAALEGSAAGAVFGLITGAACAITLARASLWLPLAFAAIGMLCGITTQYAISRSFSGCLFCAGGTLLVMDAFRCVYWALWGGATLLPLLRVVAGEVLYSLALLPLIYLLFWRVYQRVGGTRLM